jgi:hypothetical protein
MQGNENMDQPQADQMPEVEKRGNFEYVDPRSGIVHFFETEDEKIRFIEEQRDNQK